MKRQKVFFGSMVLCLALLLARQAWGGGSRMFEISDLRQTPQVALQGAALTPDGGAVSPPGQTALVGPSIPVLWEALPAAGGQLFHAAGGAPGTILTLPLKGAGKILFQANEAEITALLEQPTGDVLAAISPGGRLLEVSPDGSFRDLARSRSRYIWDLERNGRGGLWAAAGDPGALLRLDRGSDQFVRVLETGSEQIRCLAVDTEGRLLMGTSGSGRILRLTASDHLETVYDSDFHEVADLKVDESGGIIAVLVQAASTIPAASSGRSNPVAKGTPATVSSGSGSPADSAPQTSAAKNSSRVVRIGRHGEVRTLWNSSTETALCALPRPDGSVWLGTSPKGSLRSVLSAGREAEIARLPARSITKLTALADGRVLVTTGGPGTVVLVDPSKPMQGTVISPVHDAGQGTVYGRAEWWSRRGPAGQIRLSLRSGNTAKPDSSWTSWSAWKSGGVVEAPAAPPGRFVQWRARLRGKARPASELARVRVTYLPPNHPPVLSRMRVLPSGWKLEALPDPAGHRPPVAGTFSVTTPGGSVHPAPSVHPSRQVWDPGKRTIVWTESDPDGDTLLARILIRADGEPEFHILAGSVKDPFLVLDESALADGGFVVRVEVSDLQDNSEERTLQAVLDSGRFVVDTTPPHISDLRYGPSGGGHLRFQVRDRLSPPRHGRISLDGAPFRGILPADGIEDQRTETYRFRLPELSPGTHRVVIRVGDSAGNAASARLRFQVQE